MSAARVAIATCAGFPELDDDGPFLRAALADRGVHATAQIWNDPAVDWDSFTLVIIRNTFDYAPVHREFLAWAESVTRLANPAAVVAANIDKSYLLDLERRGVPIPPSTMVTSPSSFTLPSVPFVVKPAIGNGGRGAALFDANDDAALAHVADLTKGGEAALCQEYLDAVEVEGETALIFLGGTFSHALRKPAILTELQGRPARHDDMTPRVPKPEELELAHLALAASGFADDLLYARVDLLWSTDGPVVGELELIEPMLYLTKAHGAVERFADAICVWLER